MRFILIYHVLDLWDDFGIAPIRLKIYFLDWAWPQYEIQVKMNSTFPN